MRTNRFKIRLLLGLCIVAFAFIKRCSSMETNPYTGKDQVINMTADQEIAIGLQSAPEMEQQFGGLHPNNQYQAFVTQVGNKLVQSSIASQTPYDYHFHLLGDSNTVNAFALPGGQVFITYALFSQLENEAQLAGVLGHEIGHVLGRHSAERIAETEFWKTVTTGASVGADMGQLIGGIGQQKLLTNSRGDELEADDLGIMLMIDAGYEPEEMIGVMEILKAAAGPNRVPEYQSTHPDPDNRIEKIKAAIDKYKKTPI
ncbi:M48 family metalloprotease [Mangrovimonas sp. DI 80]|uniref:M48 family metalloprotease n=1 Tax=Mangrovimonas sp. DI 80 TaxID=1779330 RepID=UPI000976A24C|nr:M48 family metalloprotease [Mangrovimonas sp. DI 80]OMP31724.1 peptidase M48 Ste24p [Mangrovimonas sp. DI 80]